MMTPAPSPAIRKKVLLVVGFAVFVDMLIYGLIVPILPSYAESLGASQTRIGLLFSSYALTLFVATPLLGMLADKVGRKGPLLWGMIGLAATTVMFAFATEFWVLVAARMLQGIAAAATWTAGLALLADVYPSEERGTAMGLALSGQAAGTLLGPTVGGWLFEWGGYKLPFLIAALLALIDALLRVSLLRQVSDTKAERFISPLRLLQSRAIWMIAGVVALGAAIPAILEPTLPLHLSRHLNASPGVIGLLFAVPTIAYALTTGMIGALSTKVGHAKTIAAGLMFIAIILPLNALPDMIWLQVVVLALLGIGMGTVLAPALPKLTDLSQQTVTGANAHGFTFAVYNTAYSVGMMVGPLGSSVLTEHFGISYAYLVIGAAAMLCSILFHRGMPK